MYRDYELNLLKVILQTLSLNVIKARWNVNVKPEDPQPDIRQFYVKQWFSQFSNAHPILDIFPKFLCYNYEKAAYKYACL